MNKKPDLHANVAPVTEQVHPSLRRAAFGGYQMKTLTVSETPS